MERESSSKKWLKRGLVIGTVAGTVYAFANRKSRTKITETFDGGAAKVKQLIEVMQENREPFIEQLKTSGQKIQSIVENASDDIEKLITVSKHMKEHSQAIIAALQETKEEFEELAEGLEKETETTAQIEAPESAPPLSDPAEGTIPLQKELPTAERQKLT